ncbi:hypothetical protein KEM54_003510, partial [Ascosphaera aggregata]
PLCDGPYDKEGVLSLAENSRFDLLTGVKELQKSYAPQTVRAIGSLSPTSAVTTSSKRPLEAGQSFVGTMPLDEQGAKWAW